MTAVTLVCFHFGFVEFVLRITVVVIVFHALILSILYIGHESRLNKFIFTTAAFGGAMLVLVTSGSLLTTMLG